MIWNKFGYPVAVNYQILNMQGIEWELKPQTENKKAEWRITLDETIFSQLKIDLVSIFGGLSLDLDD